MVTVTAKRWHTVQGLPELQAQLRELGATMAARVLATAARKAFMPVIEAARARAPTANESTGATGITKESIKIRVIRPKSGDTVVQVGLRIARSAEAAGLVRASRGVVKRRDASWRWHFVEFGTVHQAARPFIRPAMDENAQQVIDELKKELVKGINKVLRKSAKSASRAVRSVPSIKDFMGGTK